jgi:hypothetical protein
MRIPPRDCFDGHSLYWLSVSSGVRINQQGFTFYDSPVRHTTPSYDCPRTLGALCAYGSNYSFFRCTEFPSTMTYDAPPPFERLWQAEGCRGKLPTPNHFDVTMCDLKDGTAIIWADNRLSVQYSMDMPYWPMLLVSLVVVWLVINMGESIASILRVKGADSYGKVTSALCVVLVLTVFFSTPLALWITERERWIYFFSIFYILTYSAFHLINPHTVNVIVGCLILITARFYQQHDTPYAAGFLFCIATRFVQKACVTNFSGEDDLYQVTRIGFMVMDAVFFYLIYSESLQRAFHDSMHGVLCLLGVLYSAWVVGKVLAEFIAERTEEL